MGDGWEHTKDLGRPREVPARRVLGRSGLARPFRKGAPGDLLGGVLDSLTRRSTASGGAGDAVEDPAEDPAVEDVDGEEVAGGE